MNQDSTLDSKIEAILFIKGEPIKIKQLAKTLDANEAEIRGAIAVLEGKLADRGLQIVVTPEEIVLGTSKQLSELIEKIQKEELDKDLSRAALETLAIILYQNKEGATRSNIDYIRGVNSSFILRNLAIRGLVLKVTHPADKRTFVYKPSTDLLSHLGVGKIEVLPDYGAIQAKLEGAVASIAEETAGFNDETES